jgi:hypothetical protein
MEISTPPVTFAERFHRLFSQARFFSVSLLVHVIVIVFASSYVMFQRLDPAPDFVSTGSLVPEEGPSGLLEEPPVEAPKLKEPEPSLPTSSSAGVIGTIANNNTFAVDTSGTAGIDLGKAINTAKGVGDMSGLGEALTKGMGKVGGTSMVKFMGQTAEVQAVVFVVDISGSMIMGNKSAKTYDHLEDEIKPVQAAAHVRLKRREAARDQLAAEAEPGGRYAVHGRGRQGEASRHPGGPRTGGRLQAGAGHDFLRLRW